MSSMAPSRPQTQSVPNTTKHDPQTVLNNLMQMNSPQEKLMKRKKLLA